MKNMLMIVMLIIVGCSNVEGGGNTTPEIINKVITPAEANPQSELTHEDLTYVELNLDDMTFDAAFSLERRAKGPGHTFWWRGSEYTTDLEETGQWVLNPNDKDDRCHSNVHDECGVCNGTGKRTWYRDLDGDGLGDPSTSMKKCNYPSVDEE